MHICMCLCVCVYQMLALKTVKVDGRGDQAEALLSSYANEIELLRSFRGSPYIINLENAEVGSVDRIVASWEACCSIE